MDGGSASSLYLLYERYAVLLGNSGRCDILLWIMGSRWSKTDLHADKARQMLIRCAEIEKCRCSNRYKTGMTC